MMAIGHYEITVEQYEKLIGDLTVQADINLERAIKAENKLIAAEKIFNHFGGLSELSKWENGQGETAVNVVQEYLKL